MSIKKKKAEKQRLYDLGWYEDDNYKWRCKSCDELMNLVFCGCNLCGDRCEWCVGQSREKERKNNASSN